ncbi:MAG: enoyl-CoA hydratase-related protein [Alphaproteobacteria bacterium]
MGEFASIEKEGHLTIITINRADRMNSLHPPANEELAAAFDDFEADPDQWVAIITGAGDKAFSAGNDLRWQAEGNAITVPETGFAGLTSRFGMTKPVIAAVNGVAMGGGFEIALSADIIVASENAVFALPEPRVGLAALAGGMQRLPRQIGLKNAMGMMLTGRRVPAAEGKDLGFVNEVVPAGEALEGAKKWAAMILECAPLSVRATKQVAMENLNVADLQESLDVKKYPAVFDMFKSEDMKEGPMAFAQKRAPNWQGK